MNFKSYFYTTSVIILTLACVSQTGVKAVDPDVFLKKQLEEKNRVEYENRFRMAAPLVTLNSGPFGRYANFEVPEILVQEILDPEKYIRENHFDPSAQSLVQHELTAELLTKRGIKELIGVGVSDFSGSTDNRIHNLEETVRRMDGLIIRQGDMFSFNQNLGEVSEESGFMWSKVIKDRQNKWGLGGGVCQVSSNVFRVALNTGLPITEWRAHSFVLGYYAPTGLDATIYKGKQDLKFKNDTPGDILMKFVIKDEKLITLIYGTSDLRTVELERTKYWVGGYMNIATSWERTVSRDGVASVDVFEADYHPPQ